MPNELNLRILMTSQGASFEEGLNIDTRNHEMTNNEISEHFGTQPVTATNIISTDRVEQRQHKDY